MMECVRLIIGEGRERHHMWRGERAAKRSVDRLIQNNLDGHEGTAMLGTKRGRSRRLPTPPTPTPREVVSLLSDYNPTPKKTKRVFEVGCGAEVRRRSQVQHEKAT